MHGMYTNKICMNHIYIYIYSLRFYLLTFAYIQYVYPYTYTYTSINIYLLTNGMRTGSSCMRPTLLPLCIRATAAKSITCSVHAIGGERARRHGKLQESCRFT